jgi:hypothetical protein
LSSSPPRNNRLGAEVLDVDSYGDEEQSEEEKEERQSHLGEGILASPINSERVVSSIEEI